ncbi:MAG TPA: DNA repair protein RecN [Pseudohongiella sp.]|nr:DNA repair protein RecN [Pseudohongiella sp.]
MLTHLSIRNYAIATELDISFKPGMTAITGETGAGKSIILGALGLALGDRADRDVVRDGCERTDISVEFDVSRLDAARQWLKENDLDSPDDPGLCLLRRSVSSDGRSRAWINNTPATLQALASLGEKLMDIHSQHEHHSLLKKATHQILLDDFAGHQTDVQALRALADQWRQQHHTLERLKTESEEQQAMNELARYQLNELEELGLGDSELNTIEQEMDELAQAESRMSALQTLLQLCRDNDEVNIRQQLQQALHLLRQLDHNRSQTGEQSAAQQQLSSISQMLDTALIQVEEAADEMNHLADRIDINPARLEQLSQRLNQIHQLARKHKVKPEELPALQQELLARLDSVQHNAEEIQRLEQALTDLQQQWKKLAEKLSKSRKQAAEKLSQQVNEQLQSLGMGDARLEVTMQAGDPDTPQAHGLETVEFLISTNRGQAPRPLAKIASGGELSRISLAIQVITAMTSQTPCLVFDEVDVGIGGSVARIVGQLLRKLGERGQVFCVTHQALVAGLAHQHYRVSKSSDGDSARSRVEELDAGQRLQEIARMLGGENAQGTVSEESLAHARELLSA